MAKIASIQTTSDWVYLYDSDNKVIKSLKLTNSGSTAIAEARLRTYAKKEGYKVK